MVSVFDIVYIKLKQGDIHHTGIDGVTAAQKNKPDIY
jgi:hypothetical protein